MGPHVVEVVLVFRGSSCSRESHDRCIKLGQRAAWKAFKRSRNKATEEKKGGKKRDPKAKKSQAAKKDPATVSKKTQKHPKLDTHCFVSISQ